MAVRSISSSYTLTQSDLYTFTALAELQFATAEQIRRFRGFRGLRNTSHSWLRQQLVILAGESKKLAITPYLQRYTLPRETSLGNLPYYLYALNSLARKELSKRGYALFSTGRIRVVKRLPSDITHHLAINDFSLSAMELTGIEPRIQLVYFRHDWKLKQEKHKFTGTVWKRDLRVSGYFSPDGWFEFLLDLGGRKAPRRLLLEMDMGTHTSRDRFKLKLTRYLSFFASGKYTQEFGNVKNITVVFATPRGDHRRDELRKWTKEQFEAPLYLPYSGFGGTLSFDAKAFNMFRFLSVPQGSLDPIATFLSPIALPVFASTPQPLIYLPA